jgi:hypothetical protein
MKENMTKLSLGLIWVRFMAESEARGGNFEAIYPEHFWMALCKLTELPKQLVSNMVRGSTEQLASLQAEIDMLRTLLATQKIDTPHVRRKLRLEIGRGAGSGERLHRSPESVVMFQVAARIAEIDGEKSIQVIHLARAILKDPPTTLAGLLIETGHRSERTLSPSPTQSVKKTPKGILDR